MVELGLFLNTHGVATRTDEDWFHQLMEPEEMKPVESGMLAERLGFHSVWMGDHVALPEASPGSQSPIRSIGGDIDRHYPPRPNILDGVVVQAAIAANTSRIKMGSSVLISPYRHPLNDARQYGAIDYISGGRIIMGVGCGWIKEEFEALGHDFYGERREVLVECMQIYDKAWTEGVVSFHGRFYDFDNMGVFPLPAQKPRPPILVGTYTRGTARLAARYADGIMPPAVLPTAKPENFAEVRDEMLREAERIGRSPDSLALTALASYRITDAGDEEATRTPRRNLGGTAEQILSDIEEYAAAGFSLLNMAPDCPSKTYAEFEEQAQRLGEEVLPEAKKLLPQGELRKEI